MNWLVTPVEIIIINVNYSDTDDTDPDQGDDLNCAVTSILYLFGFVPSSQKCLDSVEEVLLLPKWSGFTEIPVQQTISLTRRSLPPNGYF